MNEPQLLLSERRKYAICSQVFLVRKNVGKDAGTLYAMKVLKKATLKGQNRRQSFIPEITQLILQDKTYLINDVKLNILLAFFQSVIVSAPRWSATSWRRWSTRSSSSCTTPSRPRESSTSSWTFSGVETSSQGCPRR